jgi:Domain of unknown function (DUF4404)
MIDDTIARIEQRLKNAESIKSQTRFELLNLIATLKSEMEGLSSIEEDHARSITGFTDLSTHEATRSEQNPQLLKLSLEGLSKSVDGFETSHPQLVKIVNSICKMLADVGI